MAGVKGKALEVQGAMAEVESIQGQQPTSQELVFQTHFGVNGNRVGALRRLSDMQAGRQIAKGSAGSSNSATRRQPIPKPILPPAPPTIGVNPFTAQFLFKKELRYSDVGPASRIVIPKGHAEKYLPALTEREGFFIFMDDMDACDIWAFRYRYWHNNRSRMFVLEKTGEFVKAHGLQCGDFIMIYKDGQNERYGIRAMKAISQEMHPQNEVNMSRNYYADLVARNEICTFFAPENNAMMHNFPMNIPGGGAMPGVSSIEPPLSYQSITFSPGNFW
ncbi:hypothetical protein U1Q18_045112 [Sarracenia purpurea var. burkii]